MTLRLTVFGLLAGISLHAQVVDFDSEGLSKEFVRNFNIYSEAYTQPVINAFSYNSISGWNQTARIIRPYSVRLEFVAGATFTEEENITFNFNNYDFSDNIELLGPTEPILPTALGGSTENFFRYTVQGNVAGLGNITATQDIPAFSGITSPYNSTPNLVPQISVGLPGEFELTARFFPYYNYEGVSHNEFGVGVKHGLGQYLEMPKNLHWNVGIFYDLNQYTYVPEDFLEGEDQKIRLRGSAVLMESLASYDYKFVSVFGGLGLYNWTNSFSILGTYRYEVEEGQFNGREVFTATDPVDIAVNKTGLKGSAGVTLRVLKVLSLSAAYHM
ncbi:MAG: DUF6588 family protein, partial [Owenweeksia sp.]